MVVSDRVRDALQHHRFTGTRRRHNESTLPLPDRSQQVHYPTRKIVLRGLQLQTLIRIERRQIVEKDLIARFLGWLEIDRVHLN